MKISIVIPVKGRKELTLTCIESLLNHDSVNIKEVIVIDNGSVESNEKLNDEISWEKVKVIHGKRPLNFSESCNLGVKRSTAETLLFLNNDITVSEQWLDPLLDTLKKTGGVVGAKLLYPEGVIQHAGEVFPLWGTPFIGGSGAPADHTGYHGARKRWGVIAACLLMKKTLFEKIDGFDEVYNFGFEDIDLCFKAWEMGATVNCVGSVSILHHEAGTIAHLPDDVKRRTDRDNIAHFRSRWSSLTDQLAQKFIIAMKNDGIRNVALFGSGEAARMCLKLFRACDINVSVFLEADEKYSGRVVDGIRVKTLSESYDNVECIFIASQYQWRIREHLNKANLLDYVRDIELFNETWKPGDMA